MVTRLAGGDGLAVAPAVGAGQALAETLGLADVGLALVGVRGNGEHDDVGSVGQRPRQPAVRRDLTLVVVEWGGEERCFVSGQLVAGRFADGHPRMLA